MDINMIMVSGCVSKSPTSIKMYDVLYANFSLEVNVGSLTNPKTLCYLVSSSGKIAEMVLNEVNIGDKLFITGKPSVDTYMNKDKQIVGLQKIWIEKIEFACCPRAGNHDFNVEEVVDVQSVEVTKASEYHTGVEQ